MRCHVSSWSKVNATLPFSVAADSHHAASATVALVTPNCSVRHKPWREEICCRGGSSARRQAVMSSAKTDARTCVVGGGLHCLLGVARIYGDLTSMLDTSMLCPTKCTAHMQCSGAATSTGLRSRARLPESALQRG